MPLWDKVRQELDRAGRVAQDALDEGRIRLEAFRVRQLADKAAEALGYATFRAHQGGGTLEPAESDRLVATLARHEAEAARLEAQLDALRAQPAADDAQRGSADDATGATAGPATSSAAADAAPHASPPGAPAAEEPPARTATPPHGDPLGSHVPPERGSWPDPLR